MKVNINEYVKAELTNYGFEIWQKYWERIFEISRKYNGFESDKHVEKLKQSQIENEYHKFQIWEMMEIFGSGMNIVEPQIFLNNEIILEDSTKTQNNTLTLISNEVERARKKFPGADDLTVALMEECGELAQATLKNDKENIIKEAIQVAAVAIRIIEEGDATFKNRKDISQDEKYEYEKELNLNSIGLIDCEYDITKGYIFTIKWGDKYLITSKKKPTKEELRKFILGGGNIDDNWNCIEIKESKSKKKVECNHRPDGDSSACDHCCHFSIV